ADDDMSPDWQREKPSRHKWFRKRKRRKASRRQRFDDESDDESDAEDAESEPWPFVYQDSQFSADLKIFGEEVLEQATEEEVWGVASAIDIYDCDADLIRDADAIRRFVTELCDLIEMKRFGETQVVHFGEDERVAGYSMVQLIETSLISAHFANETNTVYLDVFSCKPYNPEVVREFSQAFFKGQYCSMQVAFRR
ncbi:MAG: S-adenosylmethionine decarboxylase, partial [Pirellulales bacterium]|nr:S-adenosylmethionine decarboxylase [Pirellulales bacterium]